MNATPRCALRCRSIHVEKAASRRDSSVWIGSGCRRRELRAALRWHGLYGQLIQGSEPEHHSGAKCTERAFWADR